MREEIAVVLNTLQPQLDSLKTEIIQCCRKTEDVETGLNDMHDRVMELEKDKETKDATIKLLIEENEDLRLKHDKLEAQSRKFNLRVRGLPVGAEKGHPTATIYVNNLLRELFKGKIKTEPEVEIAHRIGADKKTMIVRMQRYMAKEEILALSKKERTLNHGDMKLQFFPDLTSDMAKRISTFSKLREKLRDAGVKHGIIHPATLIMTVGGETRRFTDHEEALAFWNAAGKTGPQPPEPN